ncbi:MAG: peptide chain release factor N(5)-glutamine methyltransferase [Firmicutes bacterium]|nr:peptide chain release factor N(5)-glutamine methyltransferase [Bacillota bacterium]
MEKPRTVLELINLSTEYLKKQGCLNPRLDAELLLAHALDTERINLYLEFDRPLTTKEIDTYRRLIGLRGRRVPTSYLTGSREFLSLDFVVNENVLVPRPETELLVETVLDIAKTNFPSKVHILDLCTGSGVIAISLAKFLSDLEISVVAADISHDALSVAQENANRLNVAEKITFIESDLFSRLKHNDFQPFNIICSNPPYIPSADIDQLQDEVRQEPRIALDGGSDGLNFYRAILDQAQEYLVPDGFIAFEIGHQQADFLKEYGEKLGYQWCYTKQDYAKLDRVVVFKWTP